MPIYDLSVTLHFQTNAPNSTEARARVKDMRVHRVLRDQILSGGLVYRRRELVKCKTVPRGKFMK